MIVCNDTTDNLDLIEMVLIISDHPSTLIIYGNFKNDTCTAIIGANV